MFPDMSSYDYLRGGPPVKSMQTNPGLDMLRQLIEGEMGGGGNSGGAGRVPYNGDGELLWQVPDHYDHLHFASGTAPLHKIARKLENKFGFDVSELEGYGGTGQVTGGHSENSHHYTGNAMDVNYYGGGRWRNEGDALSWLNNWLARRYGG